MKKYILLINIYILVGYYLTVKCRLIKRLPKASLRLPCQKASTANCWLAIASDSLLLWQPIDVDDDCYAERILLFLLLQLRHAGRGKPVSFFWASLLYPTFSNGFPFQCRLCCP